MNRNGVVVLVAAVSPYREQRDAVRARIGRFVEVYCRCPLEVLTERDKGDLFARARAGEIAHVAGVNAPYEEPKQAEVEIDTDSDPVDVGVGRILTRLQQLGYLPAQGSAEYTAEEEAIIKQRLRDMGYI